MRFVKYSIVFLLGLLIARFWYQKKEKNHTQEEVRVVLNAIENLSKLVVSQGTFSEIYNYSDSKKYFYNFLAFDKKAVVTVNAKVEVGYDLSKMKIKIDSSQKKIRIYKIPAQEIIISPEVKFFDLQQSSFNTFSKKELNMINRKSIEKIKETATISGLKQQARARLFEELSKIYQLSSVYNWEVEDLTDSKFMSSFKKVLD